MNEEQADVFTAWNCYVNHLEGAYTYSRSTTARDIVPFLSRIVQIVVVVVVVARPYAYFEGF